jgi:Zn-dependent protease
VALYPAARLGDVTYPQPLPRGTLPGQPPPALPELEPQAPARTPPPPPEPRRPEPPRSALRRAGALIVAAGLLLFKFGKTALLLLGKVKFLTTSASMLVSVAAYALIWGWKFGAVFVALLFIHEIGHVIQLRREGVPASAPMFVPFLGAFVAMKELPKDAGAEARVGLAGPVLGTIGCLIPLAIWQATGEPFWQAATFIGLFLNLFNLLPVLPLDGGRAMAALSSWIWAIGFVLFLGLLVVFPSPVLILIVLLGGFETWRRWKQRGSPEARAYNRIPTRTRVAVGLTYLGLVVALGVGMELTHLERTLDDV